MLTPEADALDMRPRPSPADVGHDVASAFASSVSAARRAWLRGDFATCLATLEGYDLRPAGWPDAGEALLLLGRALLRSNRADEAAHRLAPSLGTYATFDEDCTARMLHAAAVTRCQTPERGLALLSELAVAAQQGRAHRAVRTEIAYYRALAHWAKHELSAATTFAREVQAARLDVLAVRATEVLGFIAIEQQRYGEALEVFRAALDGYRRCSERDGDMAERICLQIATLETQLRGKLVAGSHDAARARRVPGDVFGPDASLAKCQIAWLDAWQFALDGSVQSALRKMRESEQAAPSAAWRVYALSGRALISAAFGESENAGELVRYAGELAASLAWNTMNGGESLALLVLAEAAAPLVPELAADALARYDAMAGKADVLVVNVAGDPRRTAIETYVRGLVARASGNRQRACALLEQAYRSLRAVGHLWRATLALIELDALHEPVVALAGLQLETAAALAQEHFPRSFLARRIGRWAEVYRDRVATGLTPAQRKVLRYALDGYGAKEIATVTGRSVKTVGNQLASLHEAFGVNSTLRLVAECHRRGIGSPDWHLPADPAPAAPAAMRSAAG